MAAITITIAGAGLRIRLPHPPRPVFASNPLRRMTLRLGGLVHSQPS